ncbi:putative regulatory protein, FmdB family [Quadrisphaera granulorum]|uniref:Putative FmdB family regulatory protein n=1 Tax=Quadrisphaera granulorum TaxID=317664 RepID=A0A316AC31_9ACTN|nr:FmdB family zinc ribbon protein [Quadrisphaera granulorum]PWJ55171.1 putative FmdB family regulatory protein [Quadrisphaera granulorum]SZE95680.1 putative regulatory protein, FmdB family [Quadrisphaera granulorum]
MPTYAYTCTACGHSLEVKQSFSDAALTECPECAGRLRKRFDAVGVVFKGSGFYRTDSRADGKGGSSSAGSGSSSSGSSSSDSTAASSSSTSSATPSTSGSSSSSSSSSTPASSSSSSS